MTEILDEFETKVPAPVGVPVPLPRPPEPLPFPASVWTPSRPPVLRVRDPRYAPKAEEGSPRLPFDFSWL